MCAPHMDEPPSHRPLHIQLEFSATELYHSQVFPSSQIRQVIISCVRGATHQTITNITPDGRFAADFVLEPLREGVELVDTLKLFFFGPDRCILMGGYIDLHRTLSSLSNGKSSVTTEFTNRRNGTSLFLRTSDPGGLMEANMHRFLSAGGRLTASALHDTEEATGMFRRIIETVGHSLLDGPFLHLEGSGAHLFLNVGTTHIMSGQVTTMMQYSDDMRPDEALLDLFIDSSVLFYMVVDTLHYRGTTLDKALEDLVPPEEWTPAECLRLQGRFLEAVCQAPRRSGGAFRYTVDATPIPVDPNTPNRFRMELTEYFRRPLSEPMDPDALVADDCEGLTEVIADSIAAMGRVYRRFGTDPSALADGILADQSIIRFLDADQRLRFARLVVGLGRSVDNGCIECDKVMMSVLGAAMKTQGNEGKIGGHVAGCLRVFPHQGRTHDTEPLVEIMLEGTNFAEDEKDDRFLMVPLGDDRNGVAAVSLSGVSNLISLWLFDAKPTSLVSMHFSHLSPNPFYNMAFVQGDRLLASHPPTLHRKTAPGSVETTPKPECDSLLVYGVPVSQIDNYDLKVQIDERTDYCLSPEEQAWLRQHCDDRAQEIHTPDIPLERLIRYTETRWWPIDVPDHPASAPNPAFFKPVLRPHIDCVVSELIPPSLVLLAEAKGNGRAEELRREETRLLVDAHLRMRATQHDHGGWLESNATCASHEWLSIDCLMRRLSVFTDEANSDTLEGIVRDALDLALRGKGA